LIRPLGKDPENMKLQVGFMTFEKPM